MTQSRQEELLVESRRQDLCSAVACNSTVIKDLVFLNAWAEGRERSLGAFFRARQIRRAGLSVPSKANRLQAALAHLAEALMNFEAP
jgi:hypothetical protein